MGVKQIPQMNQKSINPRRLECNGLLYLANMLNTALIFANLMTIK